MAKEKITGTCKICGTEGELSKEHFPPQKANNNETYIKRSFEEAIDGVKTKGHQLQGGIFDFTLCESCNNNTGTWYGAEYVKFCKSVSEVLNESVGESEIDIVLEIFPLRIIKQIVSMFFSIQSNEFYLTHPELQQFVLDKDSKTLNKRYRFFMYLCKETPTHQYRRNPLAGHFDFVSGETIQISEISHPPIGVVMTIDSMPKDARLLEITDFSSFEYDEVFSFSRKIPLFMVNNLFSGIYD